MVAAIFLLPAAVLGHATSNAGGSDHTKSQGHPDDDKNQVTDHEDCDQDDRAADATGHACGVAHAKNDAGGSDQAKSQSQGHLDSDKHQAIDHEDCDHDDRAADATGHACGAAHKKAGV